MKVGFASADIESLSDAALRPALREALTVFRDIGFQLQETQLPDFPRGPGEVIVGAEAPTVLRRSDRVTEQSSNSPTAARSAALQAALETPARDYLQAMRIRRLLQQSMLDYSPASTC